MKKAIYSAVSFCFLFISCNNVSKNLASGCLKDTLSVKQAYSMIHHYSDSAVGHNLKDIIRFFRIDNNCLDQIASISDETTFWTGADTVTHNPVIIVETKEQGEKYPQWYLMKVIIICPPPEVPPCDTLINTGDFQELFPPAPKN